MSDDTNDDAERKAKLRKWAKNRRIKNLKYNAALTEEIRQLREENDEIRQGINSLFDDLMTMANIDFGNAIHPSSSYPGTSSSNAPNGAAEQQQMCSALVNRQLDEHDLSSAQTYYGSGRIPPLHVLGHHSNPMMMTMNTTNTSTGRNTAATSTTRLFDSVSPYSSAYPSTITAASAPSTTSNHDQYLQTLPYSKGASVPPPDDNVLYHDGFKRRL